MDSLYDSNANNSAFKVIPVSEKIFIFVGSSMSGKTTFANSIENAIIKDNVIIDTYKKINGMEHPERKTQLFIRNSVVDFSLGSIKKFSKTGVREKTHSETSVLIFIINDFEKVTILNSLIRETLKDINDGYIDRRTPSFGGVY